ncbi:transcriptional repressor general negative regulator of transcription subunit 4 [Yamadazyma tenuis]|uniref:General negative regulator of transcription subunit 4 n=1 Tax=Candida tenuis (strain ATCC 10573 / BCRC 21748 / CBS 615 / JCM 9827 / NBRC 10315 / NRRL Y-1498 / VKM Y-70) TaxID=590646 RepID=G3BEW1_CANTC|nr:uncharacterized protein CANTEDRAFT_99986 [Yamadazyma tenuis ATCC 10573]EGV60609.1 hypothetical protein CANTEDRAFT_99986 [Yamadazyma tenuis ATCC 10573]WEJ94144.1 transcriptional repressor general negative regulator of transcription subunit 4 [Yamadazyma tenuis]
MSSIDDSFISDEEEEFCPLCVEEMDISDKNFKPCPCGYQICQFCYNNIKQIPELNGRCPGCRRLYEDSTVEYKSVSAEEFKMQQMKRDRRERDKKQKEKEKKESELASKKHLAGIRVVQKNLVYVTGLNPPCNPEDLHSVLRSDRYFGRYGKISKIVINKKAPPNAPGAVHHHQNPGLVVYVTFAKKEDALRCINDMDGSLLDGKILRAAHGTTKYCSSYLRGHPCQNPNCMFLHEPGEEADSYTRKDLSTQQGIKMGTMNRVSSSSNLESQDTSTGVAPSQSNEEEEPKEEAKEPAVLPATAHWAKANSNTSSPAVDNNAALANPSAFPTLGEIFKEQKQTTTPTKPSKKKKKDAADDSDSDEAYAPLQVLDEITTNLKNLTHKGEKLVVKFNEEFENFTESTGTFLPLFHFNKDLPKDLSKVDNGQEKSSSKRIIETYLLRPIKNYHLAYQNHPIIQQQILLQQQQQQQKLNVDPGASAQQQQQQLLLLQQLQNQQAPHSQQVPQQQITSQKIPQSAPPQGSQGQSQNGPIPQPIGVGSAGAPPGLVNNSSSSQLLNQLMTGKR